MIQPIKPSKSVREPSDSILNKFLFDKLNSGDITTDQLDSIIQKLDASTAKREKLCLRSQIPICNAEDALAEKLFNGMDALSRLYGIKKLSEIGNIDEDYTLSAHFQGENPQGSGGYMNTAVVDSGAGRYMSEFKDTFLNPNESGLNKQGDESSQGKNGIGSTAAMDKSYRGTQLIVSSPPGTNEWTMAFCCESNTVKDNNSHFDYFVNENGELPTFNAESITVGDDTITHGTVVRNYDYDMGESEYGGVPRDMKRIESARRLRFAIPDPPLPIDIYDTRGELDSYFPYEGIDWVSEEYSHAIDADITDTFTVTGDTLQGEFTLRILLVKSRNERKRMVVQGILGSRNKVTFKPLCGDANSDPSILFMKNGQTHATYNYSFMPTDLQYVRRDAFITVECCDIKDNDEDKRLFKPNREDMTKKPIAQELKSKIKEILQSHQYLNKENKRRETTEKLQKKNSPDSFYVNEPNTNITKCETKDLTVSVNGSNNKYFNKYCQFRTPTDNFTIQGSQPSSGGHSVKIKPAKHTIANQTYSFELNIYDENKDEKVATTIVKAEINEPKTPESDSQKPQTQTVEVEETDSQKPAYTEAEKAITQMMLKYSEYNQQEMIASKMYAGENRVNQSGHAYENLIEKLIDTQNILESGENNFPDFPLQNGLFIEAKKITKLYKKIATNSTKPKPFVTPECLTLGKSLTKEMQDKNITKADMLYTIGHMENKSLNAMTAVFGDVIFPEPHSSIWNPLHKVQAFATKCANYFGFNTDTNEVYTKTDMGYRNNLHTRFREMNSFTNPNRFLKEELDNFESIIESDSPLFMVMRTSRFDDLPKQDKQLLTEESNISLTTTYTQSPDKANEKIKITIITIV
jgi:hypothetical protein